MKGLMKKSIILIYIFLNLISINRIIPVKINPQDFKDEIKYLLSYEIEDYEVLRFYYKRIEDSYMDPLDFYLSIIKKINKGKVPINKEQTKTKIAHFIIDYFKILSSHANSSPEETCEILEMMSEYLVNEIQILPESLEKMCNHLIRFEATLPIMQVEPLAPGETTVIDYFVNLVLRKLIKN